MTQGEDETLIEIMKIQPHQLEFKEKVDASVGKVKQGECDSHVSFKQGGEGSEHLAYSVYSNEIPAQTPKWKRERDFSRGRQMASGPKEFEVE